MKVLTSDEIYETLREIVKEARSSVLVASAWIKGSALEKLLSEIPEGVRDFRVVLRASELRDLTITDEKAFELIKEKGGKVFVHPRLHAKFVLVDGERAVVGSANFTHSGISEYEKGNVEAAVYYDKNDDLEEIERLLGYFERIAEEAVYIDGELLGFSMNPVKARSFEFVLLEEAGEQDFVVLKDGDRRLVGRIKEVYSYDMDFFANPFTAGESKVFAPVEVFKTLFAKGSSPDWKKAAVLAYLNANGAGLRIATVEVVGELVDGRLETPLKPPRVASPVYRTSEESLGELLKKNFSGRPMGRPVKVGKLAGSEAEAFVDAAEVLSKHFLVLGTTGSGKSHFTKLFLSRLLEKDPEVKLFILDPHGEYFDGLLKFGVDPSECEHVVVEDDLLPLVPEEVKELLESLGYQIFDRRNSTGKHNWAVLSRYVKPSFRSGLKRKNLIRVLAHLRTEENSKKKGKRNEGLKSMLREVLEWAGTKQPLVLKQLEDGLKSTKRVVIFNFKEVSRPETRVNAAGLVMKSLFDAAKEDGRKRLLILEEAHGFAPERGFGDASAGSDNLALVMARKIASEGRKFNLGLGVITQRPAQVSKFVLSQTNTQVMFRTINSSDLDAVSSFVEYAGEELVSLLPSLQTGTGIVCGLGVPFPILVRVE